MRRVDIPVRVRKAVTLARRRAARRGHTTGRAVYLTPSQTLPWMDGTEFAVCVRLGCTTCGVLMTLYECGTGHCRGQK